MPSPHSGSVFYIGTMGFGYDDWCQVFYPALMPARNYLSYYSRIFNAVEIDSTFYGTPRRDTIKRWAASVPSDFKFCVKTPRSITHEAGLVGVGEEMRMFIQQMRLLGQKLGVILIQFPPSFGIQNLSMLDEFLDILPSDVRFAVEVRNPSWYNRELGSLEPTLVDILRRYKICWAATDYPDVPARISLTSDFLYIRWIGQHGSFEKHDQERIDRTERLMDWWEYIQNYLGKLEVVFGFHNNDYAGFAPATANRFKAIAGLPVENYRPPQQATLF